MSPSSPRPLRSGKSWMKRAGLGLALLGLAWSAVGPEPVQGAGGEEPLVLAVGQTRTIPTQGHVRLVDRLVEGLVEIVIGADEVTLTGLKTGEGLLHVIDKDSRRRSYRIVVREQITPEENLALLRG